MSGSDQGDWHFSALPSGQPEPALVSSGRRLPARLGEYEPLEHLAEGGMGAVYRARHARLQREVAIKVLLAGRGASPRQLERFRSEGRAAGRLAHPAIVAVHDVGVEDGLPYLVMDLVQGPSLHARLLGGPLEPREAARVALGLARALEHAHARGVLHRDVKPHNVLLEGDQPRLVDFGLARLLDSSRSGLTGTGELLGTPGWMAPEQARGQADERSDVYSLGATLFAMLTGRPPSSATTVLEFLAQVNRVEAPALRALRPDLDAGLEAIVRACLWREPARRYPSAAALAEDLERWLAGQAPVGVDPSPPLSGRLGQGLAIGLVFAIAAALGAGLVSTRRAERGPTSPGSPVSSAAPPTDPAEEALARGRELLARGDQPGAAAELDRAVELGARGARFERGMLRKALRLLSDAHADLRAAALEEPNRAAVWVELARVCLQVRDERGAELAATRALELDPRDSELWFERAWVRFRTGAFAGAREDCDRAIERAPANARLWALRGDVATAQGEGRRAIPDYDRALELDPRLAHAWLNRASARLATGELEGAEADYARAIALEPENPLFLAALAAVHDRRKEYGRARELLDRAVALDPDLPQALIGRANALACLGDFAGARVDVDRLLGLAPRSVDGLYLRAQIALQAQPPERAAALADLDRLLAEAPDHLDGLALRGFTRAYLDQRQGAVSDLERFLAQAPLEHWRRGAVESALGHLRAGR